jgi:hypothetical protein
VHAVPDVDDVDATDADARVSACVATPSTVRRRSDDHRAARVVVSVSTVAVPVYTRTLMMLLVMMLMMMMLMMMLMMMMMLMKLLMVT